MGLLLSILPSVLQLTHHDPLIEGTLWARLSPLAVAEIQPAAGGHQTAEGVPLGGSVPLHGGRGNYKLPPTW